jgi:hypothetical protein
MPIENEPPQFFAGEPIRADDLNKLGDGYAYLQRYFGDRLVEVGGQPGRLPEIVEVFPALVKKASDYSTTKAPLTEPTDARYYLARGIPKLSLAAGALFDVQADDFTGGPSPTYVVATNLAESFAYTTTSGGVTTTHATGSHLLKRDGTVRVVVTAITYRHDPLKKQYVFRADPGPIFARVTSSSQDGTNMRWSYAVTQVDKSGAAYGNWTDRSGGLTGTAYNLIEDQNAATGTFGNGVASTNLTGTLAVQAVPTGTRIEIKPVFRTDNGAVEYWFNYANGIDGACS